MTIAGPPATEDGLDLGEDGVVCLRRVLSPEDLAAVEKLFDHEVAHPGPLSKYLYADDSSTVYTDFFNRPQWPHYRAAYEATAIPSILSNLWGSDDIWLFFEQVWWKTGGQTRRTPWHQDSSYTPITGDQQAIVWVPLDPVSQEHALEFVRRSHLGPMYATSNFDAEDDRASEPATAALPRLPDIEGDRRAYDIVSWGMEPGDILIFHFNTLHGGGDTPAGRERRTVSLRYFGPDAVYRPLVEGRRYGSQSKGRSGSAEGEDGETNEDNPLAELMAQLSPGSHYSEGGWPKLDRRGVSTR